MNKYIDKFKNKKVLVIGDVMLDEYWWGSAKRLASDAPIPVVKVDVSTKAVGGAANVARNILALGAKPYLCGLVGADTVGGSFMTELSNNDIEIGGIIVDASRPTTIKRRLMVGNYQSARFDVESKERINDSVFARVIKFIKSVANDIDIVVLSDYNMGLVVRPVVLELIDLFKSKSVKIVSNPQLKNFKAHAKVDVLAPSAESVVDYCGFRLLDKKRVEVAAKRLISDLKCGSVCIIQPLRHISIIKKDNKTFHTGPIVKKVSNEFGVRDVMISTIALSLVSGLELEDGVKIIDKAMRIALSRSGNSVVSAEELKGVDV